MSMPSIPGYTQRLNATLADLWPRPDGVPNDLWPSEHLRHVSSNPTGWLTVEEHFFTEGEHGGVGCVLVNASDSAAALGGETSWIGQDLGDVGVWGDGEFDNGLTVHGHSDAVAAEFFAQGRRPSGAHLPVIELNYPFLWYWDAYPVNNEWRYTNRAGREQELVRWERTEDSWKIEVRALEFRSFLAAYKRDAIIQFDYVLKIDHDNFDRVDDKFNNDWNNFDFHSLHDESMPRRKAFSRLLGRYRLQGLKTSRLPRWEERAQDRDYPTFIYALDEETGQPLTHICDPDQLGTYFDKDGTRLHYLTPIYFKREVLQPYAAEPTRYRLSNSRLSCLDLWGVSISFNSIGLVEVYLGDLGRDLPSEEWGHWRSYNVPPEGVMDEGRFRRDFLGQWASSRDVTGDLRRAREKVSEESQALLGTPIWKRLTDEIDTEFNSLIGPLTEDRTALGPPLLILTKAIVDAIDPVPLKANLAQHEKGEQSLRLLQRYVQQLGGPSDLIGILFDLQSFRSKGGVAHLAGSQKARASAMLGIEGLSNLAAFESVVTRITSCLQSIAELIATHRTTPQPDLQNAQGGKSDESE